MCSCSTGSTIEVHVGSVMLLHCNSWCTIPECSVFADFMLLIFHCPDNRLDCLFNGKASKKTSVPQKSLPGLPPLSTVSDPSQISLSWMTTWSEPSLNKSESWVFATCGGNDNSLISCNWASEFLRTYLLRYMENFYFKHYWTPRKVIPAATFLLQFEWAVFFFKLHDTIIIATSCEHSKQNHP